MENDWQKLGDVVARIVARTEGVMIERPPVAQADADLFVKMLIELYAPAAPRAAELSRPATTQAGDEA
jgi:hypothetical protein